LPSELVTLIPAFDTCLTLVLDQIAGETSDE